jgi:hypothetical protein
MTSSRTTVAAVHSNEQLPYLIVKPTKTPFHNRNIQLPAPISPSTQPPPFISAHTPHQSPHYVTGSPTNLVLIKTYDFQCAFRALRMWTQIPTFREQLVFSTRDGRFPTHI